MGYPRGESGGHALAARHLACSGCISWKAGWFAASEDGSIQGFLEILGLPFVGSGVGASAAAISKNTTKLLLQQAGIPVVDWVTVTDARAATPELTQAAEKLGYPVFVKPDAQGSSVGVHRVADSTELHDAVVDAARYDGRALIERAMTGFIEVECAVLGNHDPQASVLGEITPCNEFYDYEAKYLAEGSVLTIPARVPDETAERIRDLAVKAFKVLGCAGLARVDFFANDTDVFCNEVNTMPGFTPISMYPKLWEASGVSYSELLDRLVQLALEPPVHGHE
jgi:D-alanine-D-alanine ligase